MTLLASELALVVAGIMWNMRVDNPRLEDNTHSRKSRSLVLSGGTAIERMLGRHLLISIADIVLFGCLQGPYSVQALCALDMETIIRGFGLCQIVGCALSILLDGHLLLVLKLELLALKTTTA